MKKYSNIEIDLSLEQYYILNEEAREKNILLDDYIANILKKYIKKVQMLQLLLQELVKMI
jgi:hypothetical protein